MNQFLGVQLLKRCILLDLFHHALDPSLMRSSRERTKTWTWSKELLLQAAEEFRQHV